MKLVRSRPSDPPERQRGWPTLVKVIVWVMVIWVAFTVLLYLLGSGGATPIH